MMHYTQKAYYDCWATANVYKVEDRVMWLDKKTRRGRCMKLNRPWSGPWEDIKHLGEVVYQIKYCGTAVSYPRVKPRVVHFNQLKPFHGTSNKDQGCVAGETEPSQVSCPPSLKGGDGLGVISLEDDVFPDAVVGVLPEDPETVPRPCQEKEEPARRSQRERHPSVWTRDYQMNI